MAKQQNTALKQPKPALTGVFTGAAAQKMMAFAALILLVIFFSFSSPYFMQYDNMVSIVLATCVNGILALGITFVIITGGIDLSIGPVMTFSSCIAAITITNMKMPLIIGIPLAILAAAMWGFVIGTLVSRLNMPPFIVTLGILNITKGLNLVITETKPIYFNDSPTFRAIALGSAIKFGEDGKYQVPNAIFVFVLMIIIAAILLNKTKFGRYDLAIGSNEEATRLSGVNTAAWKTSVHVVCSAFAGVAGIVMAARLNSVQPALGPGYELEAIAAVVIGGTSMSGGVGTILGTIIGAFIISTLTNGLRVLSVSQQWQTVITGIVVILAVLMDIMRKRRKN